MGIGSFFEYPKFDTENPEDSIFNYLNARDHNPTFLRDGRQAIKATLLNIPRIKNKTCYLPKYLCESILQPFREVGLRVKFYGFIHTLKPIIDEKLEKSLLFLIDYFGVESIRNEEIIKYLENENDIIMDITHSIFSSNRFEVKDNNYYLISSLRKVFPIPDGGVVYHTNPKFTVKTIFPAGYEKMLKAMKLKSMKRNKDKFMKVYRDYEREKDQKAIILEALPKESKYILQHLNLSDVIEKRANNLKFIYENLSSDFFLFKKEEIKSPFFLPLVFKDEKQRNDVQRLLIKNDVYPPIHWELPLKKLEDELSLSKRILSIPIDQRYNHTDMLKIVKILSRI